MLHLTASSWTDDPIKASWEDVVLKKRPPRQDIRPEILRSWIRCRDSGLDPFSKNAPPILSGKKLDRLLSFNKNLIEISKPVMDMIEISIRGTGFIGILTDRAGHVLVVRGEKDILEMGRQTYILPGCLRSTEHVGTNGIGLCLLEGKPFQITGAEHYKVYNHLLTCSTAPIHDDRGRLAGTITLSGRSIGKHQHTLAIATAATDTIVAHLRERGLIEEKQRLNIMLTSIYNSISDGIIAINENQEITHINRIAAKMLDLRPEVAIGKKLQKVVRPDNNIIHAIKTKKYFTGQETNFSCPGGLKVYICRVDPISNTADHVLGTIISLTEKQEMINIAKKIGGNYAHYEFKHIIGNSSGLQKQIDLAKLAAKTTSRILIIGESGTGKELFAQAIHNHSNRRNEPFVAISCAAIPRDLVESELFGYREGAFTGARRSGMMGKFELANKGTLFLDEINGLPIELQVKLLRALQENEIMRLGDTRPIPVDVRVIAASNIDLRTEVKNSNFREDLYYRLNVVEIIIPPLRERIEDLEVLTNHTITRQCLKIGIRQSKISSQALETLRTYHWPGNIRELENCIERALLISQGKTIKKTHLSIKQWGKSNQLTLGETTLRVGVKEMIESALDRYNGDVTLAARELDIGRSTLYRKIKEFGLS